MTTYQQATAAMDWMIPAYSTKRWCTGISVEMAEEWGYYVVIGIDPDQSLVPDDDDRINKATSAGVRIIFRSQKRATP